MILYELGNFELLPEEVDLVRFQEYLRTVWQNRRWFANDLTEELPDPENLIRQYGQGLFQFNGRAIRARNYAGFIQFEGFTLYVLPKIFREQHHVPELVFRHLHFYLSYGRNYRFPFQWAAGFPEYLENWPQALINLFARQAYETLSRQPYLAYHSLTEATPYVRGRLAVNLYLREQISTGQWQQMYNEYSPFRLDNRFNRIVRYVCRILEPLTTGTARQLLQSVQQLLDEVTDTACTVYDTDHPELRALPEEHAHLLALCRWFLENSYAMPLPAGAFNLTFLAPMERVFEEFVSGFIVQHFPDWESQLQHSSPLAALSTGGSVSIRSDLWLPKNRITLDCKYKMAGRNPVAPVIDQDDIYQMLAYALARQSWQCVLLYPSPKTSDLPYPGWEAVVPLPSCAISIRAVFLPVMVAADEANWPDAFTGLSQQLQAKLGSLISPAE